jgi:hypothetical protein
MKIRISIYQEVDTDDFEFDDTINIDNNINYLVDRFVEDIHTLANNSIVREQVEVEYL